MNEIKEAIKKNRPNLSESSVTTYVSILKNLYKKIFPDDKEIDVKKFDDSDKKILDYLKGVEFGKRKTILSALFVISKNDNYHTLMIDDAHKYNDEQTNQEMTKSQEKNWITQAEIADIVSRYAKNSKKLLGLNRELTMKEFQYYQDYVILCLMSGLYIPPRRLKDWTDFKIRNTTSKDNFIETVKSGRKTAHVFCFNNYKTAKYYGEQKVQLDKQLYSIIDNFIGLNPSDWLFIDSHSHPLTPVKLNQRLNKIFEKKVSCNILRHSFLTEKYKNLPALNEMKEIAGEMGHSVTQALEYVKTSKPKSSEPTQTETPSEPVVKTSKPKKSKKSGEEKSTDV